MNTEAENREALWTVLHEQGRIVTRQGESLASLTSVVEGLGGQFSLLTAAQKEAQQQNRDDHKSTMEAIQKIAEPKERPWTPYAALVVSILVIFGLVLGNMSSTTRDLAQKDKELAKLSSNHAKEVADLKFQATKDALVSAQQSGQAGFDQITEILDQHQKEITRQWEKLAAMHDKVEDNEMAAVRDNQMLLDLKEYTTLTGAEFNERLVRIADKLQDTNVSAASNQTALKATGDYLREHTIKQGSAGHPSPNNTAKIPTP